MHRILSKELPQHLQQQVSLRGWLNNVRSLGKINFLILRDRSGFAQIVIEDKEQYREFAALQPGSVLSVSGLVVASEQAGVGVEIVQPQIQIEVAITEAPPIEYYKPDIPSELDFVLDHRPLALRNRKIQAVFRIQAEIAHAYRLYMHDTEQAVEYFAPNIIGASSEGGAEFFNVDYFGHTATLAQSSQLYKQIMVGVNERVFALMPFFRAEPSQTTRHLAEGKQFEFEMGFFTHWHDILDVQEGVIKFIVSYLHKRCSQEIELLGGTIVQAPGNVSFPRLTFAEAQKLFYARTGIDERNEPDLSPAAERELCRYANEQFGTDLIFITDWKASKRPFYSYINEENPELTNTFDLLCGGTEITSGGQRRHLYDSMVEGIVAKGMSPDNFGDYLSIFKYGMPPHGGFGMGLERLTMTLLKLKNIRETSLFPSDPKRIAGNRIKGKVFFGGENMRNEIVRLLRRSEKPFTMVTSEDGDRTCNIKSVLLRGKTSKRNYLFNICADDKLDMKAVAECVGEKCEFEDALVVQERFGIDVRSASPFGHLLNLETFFDQKIASLQQIIVPSGLEQERISLAAQDLLHIIEPTQGSFAKEST